MRALVALASLTMLGCSLAYDPSQFQGADGGAGDAGPRNDAGMDDAGMDDADVPGPDAGPPVRVRIVNAVGEDELGDALASIDVTLGGVITNVAFGCYVTRDDATSGTTSILIDDGRSEVTTPVVFRGDSLLVIAREPGTDRLAAFVRPDVPPSAGGGRHGIEYLNVVRQTATDSMIFAVTEVRDSSTQPAPLPFGTWSAEREYPIGIPASVALGYGTAGFLTYSITIVSTFTLGDLGVNGYAILTGNADVNPLVPGGPRAILIPADVEAAACSDPSLQDPQVALANLAEEGDEPFRDGPQIFGCALNTAFGAVQVNANEVSLTVPVFATLTSFGLAATATDACLPTARRIELDGMVEPGHRYLLAATGRLRESATTWEVAILREGAPTFETQMGLGFAHLASVTAAFLVDIDGGGVNYGDNLAPGDSVEDVIDASVLPAFPWDVIEVGAGTAVGRYRAPDTLTGTGGQFVVLFDQEVVVGTPLSRVAFVRSGYARAWSIGVRSGT